MNGEKEKIFSKKNLSLKIEKGGIIICCDLKTPLTKS